jgi:phosphoglycerate dehydrogenase-like enzyme
MRTGFPQPASSRPTASAACTTHVILTPHATYYSLEAEEEARTKAAQNVVSWSGEGRPLTRSSKQGKPSVGDHDRDSPKGWTSPGTLLVPKL